MKTYLKIKVKSLTAEARIIRKEERKAKQRKQTALFWGLRGHRIGIVRAAARETHLAYGLARGRTYDQMERFTYTQPDVSRVNRMLETYAPQTPVRLQWGSNGRPMTVPHPAVMQAA